MRSIRTLVRRCTLAAVLPVVLFAVAPAAHASTGTVGPVQAGSCSWGDFSGAGSFTLNTRVVAGLPSVAAVNYRAGIVDTGSAVASFGFYEPTTTGLTLMASGSLWTTTADNVWSTTWYNWGSRTPSGSMYFDAGTVGPSQPTVYVYVTIYFYNSAGTFTGSTGYWAYSPTARSYNCDGGSATFGIF